MALQGLWIYDMAARSINMHDHQPKQIQTQQHAPVLAHALIELGTLPPTRRCLGDDCASASASASSMSHCGTDSIASSARCSSASMSSSSNAAAPPRADGSDMLFKNERCGSGGD